MVKRRPNREADVILRMPQTGRNVVRYSRRSRACSWVSVPLSILFHRPRSTRVARRPLCVSYLSLVAVTAAPRLIQRNP